MDFRFEPLTDLRCGVGESPVWDDRRCILFFVDISAPAVYGVRLDGSGLRRWPMPETVGSIGLGESGRLIVALKHRLAVLDPESGGLEPLADVPGEPGTSRLNDGKAGPDGAFWVGSMDMRPEREAIGSLYRVDGAGTVTRVLERQAKVSNGLAWAPDGRTLFHSDSRSAWIDRYDFEPASGRIGGRTRIAEAIAEAVGRPDGAACDAEGFYWSAGVSAGRLNRWSREGRLVASQPVPAPAPTMPCFCGEALRTLVVTTLQPSGAAPNAQSGRLFFAPSPVAGAPVSRWADA